MKQSVYVKWWVVLMAVLLVGFVTYAFAGPGPKGEKMDASGCPMFGGMHGRMGQDCGGHKWMANLTDEQKNQFEKERNAFFESTRELRRQIREQQLALESEMIKKEPNLEAAGDIQKKISALEGDLDQQRLRHHFKMKQIFPNFDEMGMGGHHGERGFYGHQRCGNDS
jgi:Spy/CpxP family protein refolding chaperone